MSSHRPGVFCIACQRVHGENDMAKHPGFKKVQSKIEKEGYSEEQAGAILASKTRGASKAAKAKNPKLKKVKG